MVNKGGSGLRTSMGRGWVLVLAVVAVGGLPHEELEEEDSPCLHRPCVHGVCQEDAELPQGYRCFCEDGYTGHK